MFNIIVSLFFVVCFVGNALAESYKGKTIEFVISNGVGGGFDIYGRIFAKYYSEHIPGSPSIVVKNVSGASGMNGIRYSLQKNVTDGTHINLVQPAPFLWSVIGEAKGIDTNNINWIGSLNRDIWLILGDSQKIKSWDDIINSNNFIGTTSQSADGSITARLMAHVLKRKLNLVTGYKNNPEVLMALEKGEVFAASGHTYSTTANKKPDWVKRKSRYRVVLVETTFTSKKLLPNIPTILDITKDKEALQLIKFISSRYDLGRPIWTVPGVERGRLQTLRTAFDKTVADSKYKKELKIRQLGDDPDTAERLEEVVKMMYSTPENIVEISKSIITGK